MKNSLGVEMARLAPIAPMVTYTHVGPFDGEITLPKMASVKSRYVQVGMPVLGSGVPSRTSDVIYTCEDGLVCPDHGYSVHDDLVDDCCDWSLPCEWWAYDIRKAEKHETRRGHHVMSDNT
jgi:hypothetical protein